MMATLGKGSDNTHDLIELRMITKVGEPDAKKTNTIIGWPPCAMEKILSGAILDGDLSQSQSQRLV